MGRGRAVRWLMLAVVFFFPSKEMAAGESARPYFTDAGQMNYALFLMLERDFPGAAREFQRLIESFPGSSLAPQAQLGCAEAYLNAGLNKNSQTHLRLFLKNFPDSPLAAEARRMLAEVTLKRIEELPVTALDDEESARLPESPMRAVQVAFFEGRSMDEVNSELRRLRAHGVNTVIVRVFHNQGDRFYPSSTERRTGGGSSDREMRGVYFRTKHAPVVDDVLSGLTAAARSNGLKIFAWMTTRYADYGVEDDAELACKGYDLRSGKAERCRGLDLFNEDAVRRIEAIYSDLAGYDIDGVLFQDDLVLRHTEGFGHYMEALFKKDRGRSVDPEALYKRGKGGQVHYTELFWDWASWKNRRLLYVAKRLMTTVKAKRPNARFALNLMYEAVTNPPMALAWLSQDLKEAKKAPFDYFSVMAYHRQMATELFSTPEEIRSLIERIVEDASKAVGEPKRVLIKLQTVDWITGEPLSESEVVEILKRVKASGVSIALVPYRSDLPFHELGGRDVASLNLN